MCNCKLFSGGDILVPPPPPLEKNRVEKVGQDWGKVCVMVLQYTIALIGQWKIQEHGRHIATEPAHMVALQYKIVRFFH